MRPSQQTTDSQQNFPSDFAASSSSWGSAILHSLAKDSFGKTLNRFRKNWILLLETNDFQGYLLNHFGLNCEDLDYFEAIHLIIDPFLVGLGIVPYLGPAIGSLEVLLSCCTFIIWSLVTIEPGFRHFIHVEQLRFAIQALISHSILLRQQVTFWI